MFIKEAMFEMSKWLSHNCFSQSLIQIYDENNNNNIVHCGSTLTVVCPWSIMRTYVDHVGFVHDRTASLFYFRTSLGLIRSLIYIGSFIFGPFVGRIIKVRLKH